MGWDRLPLQNQNWTAYKELHVLRLQAQMGATPTKMLKMLSDLQQLDRVVEATKLKKHTAFQGQTEIKRKIF